MQWSHGPEAHGVWDHKTFLPCLRLVLKQFCESLAHKTRHVRVQTLPSPTSCKWSTSLTSIEHHCSSQFSCSYVCKHFRHPCNSPSGNPGYGSALSMVKHIPWSEKAPSYHVSLIMLIVSFRGPHQAGLQCCNNSWVGSGNETDNISELECFFGKKI